MITKETKPRAELRDILMYEIRKSPECSQVISVVIKTTRRNLDCCNWYAEWILEDRRLKCPRAVEISKQLQAQFDLA